jgi:UDP-3-O-[3-hydroxymyristoyl] glucosamine N-acyltransferase
MKINLNLKQIVELVGGEISTDQDFFAENISSLKNAKENDIAVYIEQGDGAVFDSLSLESIKNSSAGLILSSKKYVPQKNYLIVEDPLLAFQKIVKSTQLKNEFEDKYSKKYPDSFVSEQAEIGENVTVDATAVIKAGAKIGNNSVISSHVFVGKNCIIGSNVFLHPGVKVLERCVIGDNSILHSGSVVGSDGYGYRPGKTGMCKVPQIGIVRIGSHVEIGANVAIDRAAFDQTIIGDGVKLDNFVHIAHGVQVGPHTAIIAHTAIGGGAKIGVGCQIGGHVTIRDHISIGNGVKIVSKSAVINDIKDGKTIAGVPAISFLKWKRMYVSWLKLPEIIKLKDAFLKKQKKQSLFKRLFGRF